MRCFFSFVCEKSLSKIVTLQSSIVLTSVQSRLFGGHPKNVDMVLKILKDHKIPKGPQNVKRDPKMSKLTKGIQNL